jgi:hypothetical protein
MEKKYQDILSAVNDLTSKYLTVPELIDSEKKERANDIKQLVKIFKDALNARDVSPKKVETLGVNEVENLIERIIQKKKGIVK